MRYERSIQVTAPLAKAWDALVEGEQRALWLSSGPGTECFEPIEVSLGKIEPHRSVSWSQHQAGLEGSCQTTFRFAEVAGGTRIEIVREGFGPGEAWQHYAENTAQGWDEIIADLALYLETGAQGERHTCAGAGIAATTLSSDAGLRITHVIPGGFAECAGLRAGDVLIRLGGASVIDRATLVAACRARAVGDEVGVDYVRGGTVLHGGAPLSAWNFGTHEWVGHPGGYPRAKLLAADAS